jgi:hypothetical protein
LVFTAFFAAAVEDSGWAMFAEVLVWSGFGELRLNGFNLMDLDASGTRLQNLGR